MERFKHLLYGLSLILYMQVFLARKSDGAFLAGAAPFWQVLLGKKGAEDAVAGGEGTRCVEVVVIFC